MRKVYQKSLLAFILGCTACSPGNVGGQTGEECAAVTCSGHGSCAIDEGSAVCLCERGYHADGLSCVAGPPPDCDGVTCSLQGTCIETSGVPACDCEPGYIEVNLECLPDDIACAGVTCSGHGDCLVEQTITSAPLGSEDTFINSGVPSRNYASTDLLIVYTWRDSAVISRSLLKFDLSSIPAGASVTQASLTLYMLGFEGTGGDAEYDVSARKLLNHNPTIAAATWSSYDGTNA